MSQILRGDWFMDFIDGLKDSEKKFAFVDNKIREFGPHDMLRNWLSGHNLGLSTSLSGPVADAIEGLRTHNRHNGSRRAKQLKLFERHYL